MVTFLFCVILGRLFYIQIVWGRELQQKAVDQWTREIPVLAERGKISDRNGVALASNLDTYTIFVRPSVIMDKEFVADLFSEVLSLNREEFYEKLKTSKVSELTVKKHVEKEKILALLPYSINGFYYARDNTRVYPYGEFLSQILGFTSTDGYGQSGLELYCNADLSGLNGEILYETDLTGKELPNTNPVYYPAKNGLNVELTIDFEIQTIAERAMEEAMLRYSPQRASCIVLNPSTGEILALAIKPSFNLNEIPRNDLDLLSTLSRNTFFSDVYEPGSTFKILTAAANLEEYYKGNPAYSPKEIFSSARTRQVAGTTVKCWNMHQNGKHSAQTLGDALNNSCNPCFVDMALRMGKEKIYEYLHLFGYGEKTGVDFGGEANGLLIPQKAVTLSDLARISFGHTIAVTPLQLATATAAAINGGLYYSPYLLKRIYDDRGNTVSRTYPQEKRRVVSEKTSKELALLLENVVMNGSGKKAYIEGFRVGGKTGTAQKYENGVIAQGKYVSSFVGFFPANKPQYLCLVIVDEPKGESYGSVVAAPYAAQIFQGIIHSKQLKPVS